MKWAIKKYKLNSLKNIAEAANLTRNMQQEISLFDQVRVAFGIDNNELKVFYYFKACKSLKESKMKLIESVSVRKIVSLVIQHVITVFVLRKFCRFFFK